MNLVFLVLASLCLAAPAIAAETREWSYQQHNSQYLSPSEWGLEYPTCNGKRQSPVDIKTGSGCGKKAPLVFSGDCGDFSVKQTTEAYKLEVQNGSLASHWFVAAGLGATSLTLLSLCMYQARAP